jgi:ATP-dependent DNA helicase RecQ
MQYQSARDVLHSVFGYHEFRSPQDQIISHVSDGGDALVLMPTGGGKSLCYQIPALIRNGLGVVVSPLIALMQDQVSALRQLGVKASFLNSTLDVNQVSAIEQSLLNGDIDLLYIAPERLIQERTLNLLSELKLALFAIDEAHCVSQWGHDFRSDYLQLSLLAEKFPDVPRIALTATADERTREETIRRLSLQQAEVYSSGFDRPNIQYRIHQKDNAKKQLLHFLGTEHKEDAGIVYCLSRKKVEATAAWLCDQGYIALPYHAGLSAELRQFHQDRFLREDGVIIVATIAFGMGIDKPDVRFVAHLDLPKSIEAYYQETGRAGRDGEPADAWMVYGLQDVIKLRQMLETSQAEEQFKRVEQHKLNAMLGLCEITSCRRQALLKYFDEDSNDSCGNCDTCLTPVQTWDGTEAAQKALSCIYRSGQRFGVNHVIDILQGKDGDRIRQFGHDKISTFGIGADIESNQWRSVFRQLVARGYLTVDVAGYGGLQLTEQSRPLLKGEESIALRRDISVTEKSRSGSKRRKSKYQVKDEQAQLWEALRACRKELADEQGVPPYVIFHDATLMEMMEYKPTEEEQLLKVNGVGESKLEKYGQMFLKVIREHAE